MAKLFFKLFLLLVAILSMANIISAHKKFLKHGPVVYYYVPTPYYPPQAQPYYPSPYWCASIFPRNIKRTLFMLNWLTWSFIDVRINNEVFVQKCLKLISTGLAAGRPGTKVLRAVGWHRRIDGSARAMSPIGGSLGYRWPSGRTRRQFWPMSWRPGFCCCRCSSQRPQQWLRTRWTQFDELNWRTLFWFALGISKKKRLIAFLKAPRPYIPRAVLKDRTIFCRARSIFKILRITAAPESILFWNKRPQRLIPTSKIHSNWFLYWETKKLKIIRKLS